MMTCKEAATAFAHGDYTGLRARLHLLVCRHCRLFRRQLLLIESALRAEVFPNPDPARTAVLERAILDRLRSL